MKLPFKAALSGFGHQLQQMTAPENIVPFARQHFFYLLWIFFVPILLYTMAQGRELLVGLFDDHTFFTAVRATSLLAAYFLQALTIFLLPRPFFPRHAFDDWARVRPTTLNNPGVTYFLSVLPIILITLTMIVVQWDRITEWWMWPLIAVALAGFYFLSYWFEDAWSFNVWQTGAMLLGNMALCFLLVLSLNENARPFWNYYVVGSCLLLQAALLGGLSKILHEQLKSGVYRHYDRFYWMTLGSLAGYVAFLLFCQNLESLSPVFVLLLVISLYLAVTNLVIAFYKYRIVRKRWALWLFWGTAIGIFTVVFFVKSPIHRINTVTGGPSQTQRLTFDAWFQQWWLHNIVQTGDTAAAEIPVYLVAAQGGGSRAGLWTSELLNRLEVESQYRFHRHCLAITSASGGSAGVGATLALWQLARDSAGLLENPAAHRDRADAYRAFAAGMFQRNYLSGPFYDIFICEIGSRFLFFQKDRRNRNYRHQKDESLGFAAAVYRGRWGKEPRWRARVGQRVGSLWLDGAAATLPLGDGAVAPNYLFRPYLAAWYADDGAPRTEFPLYLPITTNLHTGKSGYCSPVVMEAQLFTDAIDILAAVDSMNGPEQAGRYTLPLSAATNLSQLFPLMNAFTYIPGSGNYIDGGTFENMGLTALLELYRRTDSLARHATWIEPRLRAKIRIRVIFLVNSETESRAEHPRYPRIRPKSQTFSMFSYASAGSIAGHSTFYTEKMIQAVHPPDTLFYLWMQDPELLNLHIPLGRWLSEVSIDSVERRADAWMEPVRSIVRPLKQASGQ